MARLPIAAVDALTRPRAQEVPIQRQAFNSFEYPGFGFDPDLAARQPPPASPAPTDPRAKEKFARTQVVDRTAPAQEPPGRGGKDPEAPSRPKNQDLGRPTKGGGSTGFGRSGQSLAQKRESSIGDRRFGGKEARGGGDRGGGGFGGKEGRGGGDRDGGGRGGKGDGGRGGDGGGRGGGGKGKA